MKYECGADYGGELSYLRSIQEDCPDWAAERYVEQFHGDLDYPTQVRVGVRVAGEVRFFEVTVEACPVATARRVD